MRLQLRESAFVTLSGAGAGVARIGPRQAGARWDLRTVTLTATTPGGTTVNVPTAELFLGEPSGTPLDSTYDGNRNSTDVQVTLYSGQVLSVRWAAGDAGAQAVLTVLGDNVIGEG